MPNSDEAAIVNGLKNDAQQSIPKVAKALSSFSHDTTDGMDKSLEAHATTESANTETLTSAGAERTFDETVSGQTQTMTRTTTTGAAKDVEFYRFSDSELEEAGITSKGADDVETGGTDPVDLVSGQLVASTTDVVRLGVLPLVLRRAYASGYAHGGLLGPGWASTLDVRLLVDGHGIRFLGESAQMLDYGTPAGLGLGLPAFPHHGARWPLTRARDRFRVEDSASGLSWIFPVDGEGAVRPLAEICDRNGNRITLVRDGHGMLREVVHSSGFRARVQAIETPAGPRAAGLSLHQSDTDEAGIVLVAYAYDEAGRLVSITDSSGVPYVYEWDEQDRICGWVDRNGHDYQYTYDDKGRVVRTDGSGGYLTSEISYDRVVRATLVTDGQGNTAVYHYDRFQQVVRIIDPLGGVELIERDRYGRVLSSTDALGNTARTERDASGLPLRLIAPDGTETTLAYGAHGLPVRISEPNGAEWSYEYDESGNLTRSLDPLGAAISYTYDERGAITSVTDRLGAVTTFELDAAGLQIGVRDPRGAAWSMERDAFGRVTAVTDPAGARRRSTFTTEGRLLASQDEAGGVVRYAYDPAGNLVERVDQAGAVTRFVYGPMGLRTASTDALGRRHVFAYDSELHLTRVTGPTGLAWSYTYDAAGRLVAECDFDGHEQTYRLDAAGRLIERVNSAGEVTSFDYDQAGHLIRRVAGQIEHCFAYDVTGHMVRAEGEGAVLEFTRDLLCRPIAENLDGRVLMRAYDPEGRLTQRVTPSGAVSQWSYDPAGSPIGVSVPGGAIEFVYDGAGREIARTLGAQTMLARSYDHSGRMTRMRLSMGEHLLQERTYGYRADGAVEAVTDQLRGAYQYALDALGRATAVHTGQWIETYAYDEIGTLVAVGMDGAQQRRTVTGTQIRENGLSSYDYDTNGRLIHKQLRTLSGQVKQWAYTWDRLGNLARVDTPDQGTWAYSYDPLGRRSAKTALDAEGRVLERTVFTYDGPRLVEEARSRAHDAGETVTTWDYEPNSFVPATQSRRRAIDELPDAYVDEQFHAIIADLVGTPTELVAADGTVIQLAARDLWGRPQSISAAADPCPIRFPGQYHDAETGLHYNLHRYYDPETAAYLSTDPLGLVPAPNPRAYIGNPLTESDPLGLNGESAPIPGPNLSGTERVPYGEDPMSRLAIISRNAKKGDGWTQGGRNVAVYTYKDDENKLSAVAMRSDGVHSERLGWDAVHKELGISKDQVDAIYTELQPCTEEYQNCDKWVATNFPGTPVSHSFDYAPDTAGRAAGMKQLRDALKQVRSGTLPK